MTSKEKIINAINEWKNQEMTDLIVDEEPKTGATKYPNDEINYKHVALVNLRFDKVETAEGSPHRQEYEVLIHTFSINEEVTVELAIIKGVFSAGLVLLSETQLYYHPVAGTDVSESFQKSAHDYGLSNTFNDFGYAYECLLPLIENHWEWDLLKEELSLPN